MNAQRDPHQVVEAIAPIGAPHLPRIAADIGAQLLKRIGTLPTDALHRLLREGEAIAREREAFARFKQPLGVK